jgi:hypothetical protein
MADDKPVVVGRTWADLVHDSKTGPKLDAAMARVVDFVADVGGVAADRVRRVLGIVDQRLEAAGAEPKAIPERVGVPVLHEVALEDRGEIQELWTQLLVSAATGQDVDAYYIGLVKQLSPDAARVLIAATRGTVRVLNEHRGQGGAAIVPKTELDGLPEVQAAVPERDARSLAVHRLISLGLVLMPQGLYIISPTAMALVLLVDRDAPRVSGR